MSQGRVAVLSVLTVVVTVALLVPGSTPGQAQTATADSYAPPRTPWGDPDLQGIWSSGYILTRLERPDEYEGREFLTDEEVDTLEINAANSFCQRAPRAGAQGPPRGVQRPVQRPGITGDLDPANLADGGSTGWEDSLYARGSGAKSRRGGEPEGREGRGPSRRDRRHPRRSRSGGQADR